MSTNLDRDGRVTRFAGGTDRGVCYQLNGISRRVINGEIDDQRTETQFTAGQAGHVAEVLLLDLIRQGDYSPGAARALAASLVKLARRYEVRA